MTKRDSIQKIDNEKQRAVTFCKRKRGLIKKAIELSQLCGLRIFLSILDNDKQKIVEYQSHADFDVTSLSKI